METLLDVILTQFAASFGVVRRSGRGLLDPTTWREPDLSPWTIAAALSLFLPLVPLGLALARLAAAAFKLADDPMLFLFGLLFALPAALFGAVLFALALSAALWLAAALITDRAGAAWFAAAYGVGVVGLATCFFSLGLGGYGWALVVAASLQFALLIARRSA